MKRFSHYSHGDRVALFCLKTEPLASELEMNLVHSLICRTFGLGVQARRPGVMLEAEYTTHVRPRTRLLR